MFLTDAWQASGLDAFIIITTGSGTRSLELSMTGRLAACNQFTVTNESMLSYVGEYTGMLDQLGRK